ncbi:hypothetical protein SO802_008960 [Lithocarpus litseifolius]|uniref:FAD synthase n=1 Tax=Lithocarpus litseifolius TaxID=425828 RepID=A0AAW2DA41_9ROSI
MIIITIGGIVALGKFDALHVGHRELAIQAAKDGPPFLLSIVGMAEVHAWWGTSCTRTQVKRQRASADEEKNDSK